VTTDRAALAGSGEDDEGSWQLRSVGAWAFALGLWIVGLGGITLFAQDGLEVAVVRSTGIPGTVTIQNCAHTKSYTLCYGPFDASNGSVHLKRLELRTIRHDQPGRVERTWLRNHSATHAWASDVSAWDQLIPVAPFVLLGLIQTVWITASWQAWRRRRRLRRRAPGEPPGPVPGEPPGPALGQPPGPALGQPPGPALGEPPAGSAPGEPPAEPAPGEPSEPGYPLPLGPYPPIPTSGGHLPPGPYPPQPATIYPPGPATGYPPGPATIYPPGPATIYPPVEPPAGGRSQPESAAEPQ
jgi:hypothetical protein